MTTTVTEKARGATISVVVPVFNNAGSLDILFEQFLTFEAGLADKGLKLDLIFVDDGSSDGSYGNLLAIKERRPGTKVIKLTRNFGAVPASRAGLRHADGDALSLLAQRAIKRDTGARALRTVMEEVMLDLMYDLPELKIDGARYVLDRDAIEQKKQLAEVLVIKKESA